MTIETDAGTLTLTRSKYAADRIARAVNLVAEGRAYATAGKIVGIPSSTVEHYIRCLGGLDAVRGKVGRHNHGNPSRRAVGFRARAIQAIEDAQAKGASYAEAVTHGMTVYTP